MCWAGIFNDLLMLRCLNGFSSKLREVCHENQYDRHWPVCWRNHLVSLSDNKYRPRQLKYAKSLISY